MSELRCIVYFSSAIRLFSEGELQDLLINAREFNKKHNVTGCLLYHDGSFIQYIEGADDNLMKTYKRITDSSQHKGIIKVLDQFINVRSFPDWTMGYSNLFKPDPLILKTISWIESEHGKNDSKGGRLLMKFFEIYNKN